MLWANEIYVMFQEADRRFQIQYILSRTKDMGKKACAVKKVAQTIAIGGSLIGIYGICTKCYSFYFRIL